MKFSLMEGITTPKEFYIINETPDGRYYYYNEEENKYYIQIVQATPKYYITTDSYTEISREDLVEALI